MYVTFIPGGEIHSDLGITNAARVSLAKQSQWIESHRTLDHGDTYGHDRIVVKDRSLSDADTKLIHYLAQHQHWTPFGHSRLYFSIQWKSLEDQLRFYKESNLAGFAWVTHGGIDYIKGSLYSWVKALPFLRTDQREYVMHILHTYYPVAAQALHLDDEPFSAQHGMLELAEEYIVMKDEWKLATATLLVKAPLFVARQIRTSQVGIGYSDLYVEGESFCYNEVSRRYVSTDPEFYFISVWRVRDSPYLKQGSTGDANDVINNLMRAEQVFITRHSLEKYLIHSKDKVAPEQLRALLPQSMYTEFYMTATLHRWAQWLNLRLDTHVQEETRFIASRIADVLCAQFPLWYEAYWSHAWESSYISE